MPDIWLKQCPICCTDLIPLKDFRFFSCGHKWCLSCSEKHEDVPLCGECRQPKGIPHQIYLDLEDLADDQVVLAADRVDTMNIQCSSSDVEDFDEAVSKVLLEAVEDLEKQVATSTKLCSELIDRNEVLDQQVEYLQFQIRNEKEESKRLRFAVEKIANDTTTLMSTGSSISASSWTNLQSVPVVEISQTPPPPVPPKDTILFYVKALYDYTATAEDEFDFKAGDMIAVTATPDDGWWAGALVDETRRVEGGKIFPSNFVCL